MIQQDEIVPIPPNRVRYFGTTGRMLLPSPTTVAALIATIPARQLITTDLLRRRLTEQFAVEGTCPVTTQRALHSLSHDPAQTVAYWRVVNQGGQLIARFPGGAAAQAERLQREGFSIDRSGKVAKVKGYRDRLVVFE